MLGHGYEHQFCGSQAVAFVVVVLAEPRAWHMPDRLSTTEPHPLQLNTGAFLGQEYDLIEWNRINKAKLIACSKGELFQANTCAWVMYAIYYYTYIVYIICVCLILYIRIF